MRNAINAAALITAVLGLMVAMSDSRFAFVDIPSALQSVAELWVEILVLAALYLWLQSVVGEWGALQQSFQQGLRRITRATNPRGWVAASLPFLAYAVGLASAMYALTLAADSAETHLRRQIPDMYQAAVFNRSGELIAEGRFDQALEALGDPILELSTSRGETRRALILERQRQAHRLAQYAEVRSSGRIKGEFLSAALWLDSQNERLCADARAFLRSWHEDERSSWTLLPPEACGGTLQRNPQGP